MYMYSSWVFVSISQKFSDTSAIQLHAGLLFRLPTSPLNLSWMMLAVLEFLTCERGNHDILYLVLGGARRSLVHRLYLRVINVPYSTYYKPMRDLPYMHQLQTGGGWAYETY